MHPFSGAGALRCSIHTINYPRWPEFQVCPICKEATTWFPTLGPDEDWREKVVHLLEGAEPEPGEVPEGVLQLTNTPVAYRNGYYFIDSRDVVNSGVYHHMRADAVIRIGKQMFEVQGYSYTRREYLIEPIGLTDEAAADLLG